MSQTKTKVNDHSHLFTVEGKYSNFTGLHPLTPYKIQLKLVDTCEYGPNNPGWKQLLAFGADCTTALNGYKFAIKAHPGQVIMQQANDPRVYQAMQGQTGCSLMVTPIPSGALDPIASNIAASRYLKSFVSAQSTWRGGNFMAELKDSVDLVLHPVRSVYKQTWEYTKTVKKIGRVYALKPRTAAAALSESWLAFSFGVKPFLQDANDAAQTFNELSVSTRHDVRIVKGKGTNTVVKDGVTPEIFSGDIGGAGNSRTLFRYKPDISVNSVTYRAGLVARPYGMGNVIKEFGFGVFDVVPAAWEAIPWSFFVDYFANVAEMLDAMRLWNANLAWSNRTIRNMRSIAFRMATAPQHFANDYIPLESSGYWDLRGIYVNRAKHEIPCPSFQLKMPGTSPYRWLNITSLIGVINDARWGSSKAPPLTLR